jgi:sarcosine oxidase
LCAGHGGRSYNPAVDSASPARRDGDEHADVVIVGCGAAGLATARELAGRGRSVIALDRFEHGHTRGSSHGTERIVRMAYTDPVHVRMAVASVEGWQRLEHDADTTLLTATGGLDAGAADELDAIAAQCAAVGVATERLTAEEATARFAGPSGPWFAFDSDVLFQPRTWTVNADLALVTLRRLAERSGADIRAASPVTSLESFDGDLGRDGGVIVGHRGGRIHADRCVITTGAWGGEPWIAAALGGGQTVPPMRVTQELVGFFEFRDPRSPDAPFPTFILREHPAVYGLPTPEGLLKVGEHHAGPVIDPDAPSDSPDTAAQDRLVELVRTRLPAVLPRLVGSTTCLYAAYPDDMFLMDRAGPVVIGLGFSGHGFKFVPEIGRRLADLAEGIEWPHNPFAFGRDPLAIGASGHR